MRAGAKLSDADKEKLKAMNAELATLATLQAERPQGDQRLGGARGRPRRARRPERGQIAAAADAAKAAGHEGKFLCACTNTTGQPPLSSLENRALREKVMKASLARGSHGGEFDNRATRARIAKLRAERAALARLPEPCGL